MFASDPDILAFLGHPRAPLLGSGGEAHVYALDQERIARILRPGARRAEAEARAELLREIAQGARHLSFATPQVERVLAHQGRILTIEKRLPGQPLAHWLAQSTGAGRQMLLAHYLDAAAALSGIAIRREKFGSLLGDVDLRAASWNGFLRARLRRSLAACPDALRDGVAAAAEIVFPEPVRPALVHLDYFPANVLAQAGRITAVLDFGPSTIIGDALMEAWSVVAYLDPELSPHADDADRAQALDWLAAQGLLSHYPQARRWLAAYWSFATDDAALMAWCRRALTG